MKHEYKTKEYKEQILNDYFESKMSIVEFCKDKDINSSTFGRWVSYDERFIDRRRSRLKCHSKKYTYEQKLRACELHEEGISYLSIAKTIGCSKTSVIGWYNTYKKKGEYYLMDKNDIINNSDDEFVKIKMQNEELKQKNRKLQLENDVYEEALRVLKNYPALSLKASLKDLTNSVKTEIINNLRAKYSDRYMLKDLLEFLDLKERTYHDNRTALNRKPKYEDYDKKVLEFILGDEKLNGKQGYRTIMSIMKTSDDWGEEKIIERRIRKTMKENGLSMNQRKSMKKHDSYKDDGNEPMPNWLYDKETKKHFFNPNKPWEILGTDVTEFHVNGFKVFLSPIIDFYDSMPITWRISQHPDTDLIVGSVEDLLKVKPDGEFILHMDQGSVNRSYAMKDTCKSNHILQSMSRKGRSGDNAPTEGFFGRLKQEWFNKTDFTEYTYEMFVKELHEWLLWYVYSRPCGKHSGLTPIAVRKAFGLESMIGTKETAKELNKAI